MAEAEVSPVPGLVGETLGVLDGSLQTDELAHEVAPAADGRLRADADELLDDGCTFPKGPRLHVVVVAHGVDINVVKVRERGFGRIQVIRCQRRSNVGPPAVTRGPDEPTLVIEVGGGFFVRRLGRCRQSRTAEIARSENHQPACRVRSWRLETMTEG